MKTIIAKFKQLMSYLIGIWFLMAIIEFLGLLGAFGGDNSCFFRYNFNKDSNGNYNLNDSAISSNIILNANGHYDIDQNLNHEDSYGKWVKANVLITKDNPVKINIQGEVSLCKSYLSSPNLQSDNLPKDYLGNDKKIEIPRVGTYKSTGTSQDYVSLIFDSAKYGSNWRNVVDITPGDKVLLTINPNNINSNVSFANDLYGEYKQADCTKDMAKQIGETSPLCGRYPLTKINGMCTFKPDPIPESAHMLYKTEKKPGTTLESTALGLDNNGYFFSWEVYFPGFYDQPQPETDFLLKSNIGGNHCVKGYTYPVADDFIAQAKENRSLDILLFFDLFNYDDGRTYYYFVPGSIIKSNIPDHDPADYNPCHFYFYTYSRPWGYVADSEQVSLVPYSIDTERVKWPDRDNDSMNCDNCIPDISKGDKQDICYSGGVDATKIWFTADNRVGLRQRLADDGGKQITEPKDIIQILTSIGTQSADKNDDGKPSYDKKPYDDGRSPPYTIYNESPPALIVDSKQYLQLAFQEGAEVGGYVVNIQHTKCVRNNGSASIDSGSNGLYRGKIKYLLLPYGKDPNQLNIKDGTGLDFDIKGDSNQVISLDNDDPDQNEGAFLWFKVDNVESDYKDSWGSYTLKINYTLKADDFVSKILNPIIWMIKDKVFGKFGSKLMFQKMTCSGKYLGDSTCTNYFSWIKAILNIYVIIIGMQFLLGMAKFNSKELIIRLMKIIVVAGLINGNSFIFFQETLFPLIIDSLDEIIANISGYTTHHDIEMNHSPFGFVNNFMTKILFNKVFYLQVLSTLSMGLISIPFFIMIAYSFLTVFIVVIQSIAIYIMSFLFIGLLIIIGPIFLVFMLFDRTRYLFNNWVAYLIRYCLEPVLVLAGIIILLQLYEIYLDQVLGFSTCWKCAWPFKIPIIAFNVPGLPDIGTKTAIFCINWFIPWGYEASETGVISFYDIIAILILSTCMTHYLGFITQAADILLRGPGEGSAPSLSKTLEVKKDDKKKKAVSNETG